MASIPVVPATPTPVFVTEARKVRADDRPVAVEKTVDISPETRKPVEAPVTPPATNLNEEIEAPLQEALSEIRHAIERLDGEKDASEVLTKEESDQNGRSLQASEAYSALRKPEPELTPVGTI